MRNLAREGLGEKAVRTGDIMYEAVLLSLEVSRAHADVLERWTLRPGEYGLVTLHRAENTDDPRRLRRLLEVFNGIAATDLPLVLPLHPRTARRLSEQCPDWVAHSRLHVTAPLGYFEILQLLAHARVTLTDSGGLQKEAFFVGCPCVTLREETEWVETVEGGGNVLAGADPQRISAGLAQWKDRYPHGNADFSSSVRTFFGPERVSAEILRAVSSFVGAAN
jgi:UDP-N-acetylglucosamine 2-epimerase